MSSPSWFIALIVGILPLATTAQASPSGDWAACIVTLDLPTDAVMVPYSPGTTTITARLTFQADGSNSLRLEGGGANARNAVAVALGSSSFRGKRCAGKSLTVVFTFVVEGTPTRESYPARTVMEPPNHFLIYFHPRLPIEEIAPPAPMPRH